MNEEAEADGTEPEAETDVVAETEPGLQEGPEPADDEESSSSDKDSEPEYGSEDLEESGYKSRGN